MHKDTNDIIKEAWRDVLKSKLPDIEAKAKLTKLSPPWTLVAVAEKKPAQNCEVLVSRYDPKLSKDMLDEMLCGTMANVIRPPVSIFLSGQFDREVVRGEIDENGKLTWSKL